MKVVVLGAGVVGVTTAYYLARAGFAVTVVDRQPGPALETSFANGGQIAPAHADPWANPRTPRKLVRWLGRDDAPLLFRLRADPKLFAWGLRFLANCPDGRSRRNMLKILRLALYSRESLGELRDSTGMHYHQRRRGILHVYRDPAEFAHAQGVASAMRDAGLDRYPVSVEEAVRLEPALADAAPRLTGALYSPGDESGDAHNFTVSLAAEAVGLGVDFRFGNALRRVHHRRRRITGVETDEGLIQGDDYVVCLGSFSPLFLAPLGIRLPVYPAKGYSITVPLATDARAPDVSITDDEHKMVFSRLGPALRAAGTAELDGWSTACRDSRIQLTLNNTLDLFPGCGARPDNVRAWCGLRPKTPDSVPVLGPTRYDNLWLNTGHGSLGWTLACGSARVITDTLAGHTPGVPLDGLTLGRFSWS